MQKIKSGKLDGEKRKMYKNIKLKNPAEIALQSVVIGFGMRV